MADSDCYWGEIYGHPSGIFFSGGHVHFLLLLSRARLRSHLLLLSGLIIPYVEKDSSDSDVELVNPKPRVPRAKRRRILNSSEIANVPIYSNKVNSSLKLYPNNPSDLTALTKQLKESLEEADSDGIGSTLQIHHSRHSEKQELYEITDSEDEAQKQSALENERNRSPSPPPSAETPKRKRGRAYKKIREVDAALKDLDMLRSPTALGLLEDDVVLVESSIAQNITVKVRRHSSLHRISLKMTDPLHTVVNQMASMLKVNPSQILLMLRDEELQPGDTPLSLNLTIADIIDCIVVSQTTEQQAGGEDTITLRIQGQEKQSHLSITVRRTEPLKVLMEKYKQAKGLQGKKVSFLFEGRKLTARATAEQLGMEPDDVIELWA